MTTDPRPVLALDVGGTKLVITESGFDRLPASRYDKAFRENTDGWAEQMPALERYVTTHP